MFMLRNYMGTRLIQIGLGLLFLWGGVEKFFEGFLGGVGLNKMAEALSSIGLSFLGPSILVALAILIAMAEAVAGVSLLINKRSKRATMILIPIVLVALALVHIPSGNWLLIMLHVPILTSLIGLSLMDIPKAD